MTISYASASKHGIIDSIWAEFLKVNGSQKELIFDYWLKGLISLLLPQFTILRVILEELKRENS